MGGPNGGDGGKGGDIWLVADHNVSSLLAFRDHPHRRAGNGVHGQGKGQARPTRKGEINPVPGGPPRPGPLPGGALPEPWKPGGPWAGAGGWRRWPGNAKFLSNK